MFNLTSRWQGHLKEGEDMAKTQEEATSLELSHSLQICYIQAPVC